MARKSTFHVELSSVPAAVLEAMVDVTITREPAKTVVIINGVKIPQSVSSLQIPRGPNTLRVGIKGKAGESGAGTVSRGGKTLSSRKASIPAGLTEAYSSEDAFDV